MSFLGQGPGIPIYKNDGKGRDTYISFANGGFSNYPYSRSYKQDNFEINRRRNHPDLYQRRPIIKYNMDGRGRDFFIQQNILSDHCRLKDFADFPHMLRTGEEINPIYFSKSYRKSKFEKNLINRIFYGKSQGIKDRLMQPKVKFTKKNSSIKYNLTNPGIIENEDSKAEEILKANNDVINMYSTNPNKFNKNKKLDHFIIKSMSTDRKRTVTNKKNNEDNEQDFIKGLKSLYLFNQKRRGSKEIDLTSLI